MSDWHVRKGNLEFGWKDGKAVTNETAEIVYQKLRYLGYRDYPYEEFVRFSEMESKRNERVWALWVKAVTSTETEYKREVTGEPPWHNLPGAFY